MTRTIASLLTLAMLLTACGGGTSTTADDDASSEAAGDSGPLTNTDGTLVIYSGRSEDLVAPLIDRFTAETGIELSVRYDDSTQLATTLLQEAESSDADVFFAQDPASLGVASPLLTELDAELLAQVPDRFSSDDGTWIGTSGRVRVVIYDTETVADADLPNSLEDMIDPRWSGRIAVAPTNGSFLAFVAAMIVSEGEEYTLDWLERLAALDPLDFPGNSPIVSAADAGEVGIGLVNHYYLYRLRAEGAGMRAANHVPTAGDASSLVMPAGAGIIATTDQPEAARRFIEFLLSEDSQLYFATETFEYPLVPGVDAVEGLVPLDSINTPDIDLSELADHLDRATDLVTEAGLL